MPFFNFRRTGATPAASAAANTQPDSLEVIRKRAKHRLIGAAVLVLAGIVGFPLLFDTQPRPIAVDIPIEIPGKNAVKPLPMTVPPLAPTAAVPAAPASAAVAPATPPAEKVAATASLAPTEEILIEKKASAPVLPAPSAIKKEAVAAPKPDVKPDVKPKTAAPADDGARARALLSGEDAPAAAAAAGDARMVVQVGAFADAVKAREVRLKLEKAGLKTYTQVADTATGKRIRVRVGPFVTRAEAEKAASKIKTLELPAAILTL